MPKLKPFTVSSSNKNSEREHEFLINPNVTHSGNGAPNWIYKNGSRIFRFQNKKGVKRFFNRRFDNVELN